YREPSIATDGQLSYGVTRNRGPNSISIIIDTNLTNPKQGILKLLGSTCSILCFTSNTFLQVLIKPNKLSLNRLTSNIKRKVVLNKELVVYGSGASHREVDPIRRLTLNASIRRQVRQRQ
ncbi:LOW QUALITY PROTEIN: hypothetical protein PanWU01x14_257560, partial [Parasponia andersonii]